MHLGKERVRLLLLDHPSTRSESFRSSSNISNCPISILSTVWCMTILVISVIFLGFMALALVLQKDGISERYIDRPVLMPGLDSRSVHLRISGGPYDDDMMTRGMPLTEFNNPNNIYILSMRSLEKETSCSLESILRKTSQNVFFMHIRSSRKHGYEKALKAAYPQLSVNKLEEKQFIKESFFEDIFNRQSPSLSIARNYILWQFGGTVITKNLLVSTADWPTVPNGTCLIGPGFVSCPMVCSSFVYQLILNTFNNQYNDDDRIVRQTVEDFCDQNSNCSGIERLKNICNQPGDNCDFILMDNWELNDPDLVGMIKFCPLTYRFSRQADDLQSEGINVLKMVKGLIGGSKTGPIETTAKSDK